MDKTRVKTPFRPVYPSPAGLIVSVDPKGKPNVMTAGEIFNIGLREPCIIGIALRKATYTHSLIVGCKEFTVNFPTVAMLETVDRVGSVTGRDGFDKFAAYGLSTLPSDEVSPPIIRECPVNLECKMLNLSEVGDHDLFLGEVVAMHVDEDKLDENEKVIIEKVDGFLYAEWGYYRIGEQLGTFLYTQKK